MSILKVNTIKRRSGNYVTFEDILIDQNGIIDTSGNTNLKATAEESEENFIASVPGNFGKVPKFKADGQLETTSKNANDIASASQLALLQSQVDAINNGGPFGTYADLSTLNGASADTSRIYYLEDSKTWAYYDGENFVDSGKKYLDNSIFQADMLRMKFSNTANISVNVWGPKMPVESGETDFISINDAIEYLVKNYYPTYKYDKSFVAEIVLISDFMMEEQVLVNDLDLGWIRITSEYAGGDYRQGISSITPGTPLEPGVPKEVNIEFYETINSLNDLNGSYLILQAGNEDIYCFWFNYESGGIEPSPEGISVDEFIEIQIIEEGEESVESLAEVVEILRNEIDDESEFTISSFSTYQFAVENTTDGPAMTPVTEEDSSVFSSISVISEGEEAVHRARFHHTGSAGLYETGGYVIIRDHAGTVEEVDYNGYYEVLNHDDDWFEVSMPYEESRVGSTYNSWEFGDIHGETINGNPIIINGDYLIEVLDDEEKDNWEFWYVPAFGVARGQLPRIACIFQMNFYQNSRQDIADNYYAAYLDGFCATDQGKMNFEPYSGIFGAGGCGIYGTRGSLINANDAIASDCGRHGFWAYSNTIINARRGLAVDNGWRGYYAGRNRIDNIAFSDELSGCGIIATRGSIINADGATCRGNYSDNLHSEHGSLISAPNVEVGESKVGLDMDQRYGAKVSCSRENSDGLHTNNLFLGGQRFPKGVDTKVVHNYIRNGNFSVEGIGWDTTTPWIIIDNIAYFDNTSTNYIRQDIDLVIGDQYALILDIVHPLVLELSSHENMVIFSEATLYEEGTQVIPFTALNGSGLRITASEQQGAFTNAKLVNLTEIDFLNFSKNEIKDILGNSFFETTLVPYTGNTENKLLSVVDGAWNYFTVEEVDQGKLTGDTHISTWDTRNVENEVSTDMYTIKLPVYEGSQNFRVLWGDGSPIQTVTEGNQAVHTYDEPGIYTIKLIGPVVDFGFQNEGDKLKILRIEAWGKDLQLTDSAPFQGCENLIVNATDVTNATYTTMEHWFENTNIVRLPNMVLWDTTGITSLAYLFSNCRRFNQFVGNWNVSQVEDMSFVFHKAEVYNQPVERWDVSQVTSMEGMFKEATLFNQSLTGWADKISEVENMDEMFYGAVSFDGDVSDWVLNDNYDISMRAIFKNATSFTGIGLETWNVEHVVSLESALEGVSLFYRSLGDWDVRSCANFSNCFKGTTMTPENYTDTITSWALKLWDFDDGGGVLPLSVNAQGIGDGLQFIANRSIPENDAGWTNASDARQWLIDQQNWSPSHQWGDTTI